MSAPPKLRLAVDLRWRRLEQALAAGVLLYVGVMATRCMSAAWHGGETDDAYITMRYARHLAEGHGISWNVGETEPVEGYSNFLFVLLGALAFKVGGDPITLVKVLCCGAVAPTCVLLYVLARRWVSPLPATLPAVLLTSYFGLFAWAVSGLETTLFQHFVVAATTAFVLGLDAREAPSDGAGSWRLPWSRYRWHLASAGFCLLASLTRAEGPVLVIVLGATALLDTSGRWLGARRSRDSAGASEATGALLVTARAFALAFVLPYGAYFLWRAVHFGHLVPNTVLCKNHYKEHPDDPQERIHEFWDGARVFILLALVQDPRRLGARALPLFLLPLVYVRIVWDADGIIGQFLRHFLASLALLVVASSLGLDNLAKLLALPLRFAAWLLRRRAQAAMPAWPALVGKVTVTVACLVLYAHAYRWLDRPASKDQCSQDRANPEEQDAWLLAPPYDLGYMAACYGERNKGREALGRYLDRALSPEQTYVIGDDGIVPYYSRARVIDSYCLNSPELTRPPIDFDTPRFVDSILKRAPDAIVVQHRAGNSNPVDDELHFYPTLVADPRFREGYQRSKEKPVFHAEGFDYALYEKKR